MNFGTRVAFAIIFSGIVPSWICTGFHGNQILDLFHILDLFGPIVYLLFNVPRYAQQRAAMETQKAKIQIPTLVEN